MPESGPDNTAIQNAPQTGASDTQQPNWDDPANPWKTNFENYRVEADRRATQLSRYESLLEDLRSPDIERQRRAAAELQVELVEDEPDYDDGGDPAMAEIARLRQEQEMLAARLAERDQKDELEVLSERIDARIEGLGLKDEADEEWVLARAVALGKGEDGLPRIKEAYDQLVQRDEAKLEARMREWAENKRLGRTTIQPGTTGTETKSVADMTDAERIEWAAARLEDAWA